MAQFHVLSSHRFSARTGDTTGVAAATASAGFVFASRWGNSAGLKQRITSIEAGLIVTTGFTAAQLLGYDLAIGRTYTVSSSGGTAGTLTTENTQMRSAAVAEASRVTSIQIAQTGALTAGTITPDAALIGMDMVWALAATAGAKIQKVYDFTDSELGGLILQQDEGIISRNLILQGAAGTVQFFYTMAWDEGLIG